MVSKFNDSKHFLGPVCAHGHEWENSGYALRYIKRGICVHCTQERCKSPKHKESLANWRLRNKSHISQYNSNYHNQHRDFLLEYKRDWSQANRDRLKPLRAQYHKEHREERNKQCRDWYQKNKDREAQRHKVYYSANQARIQQYSRDYSREHRDERREYERQQYANPQVKVRINAKNRRRIVRKKNNHVAFYSPDQLSLRIKEFDGCCAYCGKLPNPITWDHLLPISKGGPHNLSNLLPCCRSCNSSKSNKDVLEWFQSQPFWDKKRWKKILTTLGKTQHNYTQIPLF